MKKDRYSEWVNNSFSLIHIESLLVGNVQGLGLSDVELIKEFLNLKVDSQLEEEHLKKLRHTTLSELWVMGAYELVREIDEITSRIKNEISKESIMKIKETLTRFTQVRIPLAKFKKYGQNIPFSGVISKYDFNKNKGLGWNIIFSDKKKIETKIFYRKDLADSLLDLLNSLKKIT
jgi:hypothetical protein